MTAQLAAPSPAPSFAPPEAALPGLMLLVDGRFPAGGHAHSGGFEAAAEREGIKDVTALEDFLLGRLNTTGLVAAAFAAAVCGVFRDCAEDDCAVGDVTEGDGSYGLMDRIEPFDLEFEARTPSPVLRTVSRRLGRQLIRAGRRIWPQPALEHLGRLPGDGLHQPIAFGAVAGAAGQLPLHAAVAIAQESIAGPATASVRLLGLDPFDVNATVARLSGEVWRVASEAAESAEHAGATSADLPARAGYILDISAEIHATWEVRLFAS